MRFFKKIIVLIISLSLMLQNASAAGVLVENPSALAQMVAAYQKYVEMLEQAQTQIQNLSAISSTLTQANSFIKNGNLTIANPLTLLEELQKQINAIKNSFTALATTLSDYKLTDHIKTQRLKSACPWIDFDNLAWNSESLPQTNTGEETELMKDLYLLMETFTDVTKYDLASLKPAKGYSLAMLMCKELKELNQAAELAELDGQMQNALLANQLSAYQEYKEQRIAKEIAYEQAKREDFEAKLKPMLIRINEMKNQLGVTNAEKATISGVDGVTFCEKTTDSDGNEVCNPLLLEVDYIIAKENQKVQEAANKSVDSNEDAAPQSEAEREQMIIDYLREIAKHMAFLNESIALTSQLIAEEKMAHSDYGDIMKAKTYENDTFTAATETITTNKQAQSNYVTMDDFVSSASLDSNGFPTFNVTSD